MAYSYPELRNRLMAAGLWPQGRMAHLACYLAGMAVALFALEKLLGVFAAAWGEHLTGWVEFLALLSLLLFSILGFRWSRSRILWRLRNRLIVTYVFIGVIPVVLLVAMTFMILYGLAGQFAVFIVTSEIHARLRSLDVASDTVSSDLAARIDRGAPPSSESLAGLRKRDPEWAHRQVCAWYKKQPLSLCKETSAETLNLPGIPKTHFQDIVSDNGHLYLRAVSSVPIGRDNLIVITSEPFDKDLVGNIAVGLGEVTLFAPEQISGANGPTPSTEHASASSSQENADNSTVTVQRRTHNNATLRAMFTVGTVPASAGYFDQEVLFGTPLPVVNWNTGRDEDAAAAVRTRPSILYGHLFAALGEFVHLVEYSLIVIAVILAIIELVALIIGTRMTRTVTAAIAQLHAATRHVDRGDFSHRIPVKSQDQLADLALSFNSMTASIEKLILEQKEKQRLESELAIAQEVQAQLFPHQFSELESLEVHGFCRPARTVSGDYYDFLTASSHKLILAVGDISGKGISAALLMATIHSAVRAYSMESMPQLREPIAVGAVGGSGRVMASWPEGVEVSPGAMLGLLNHQLYESTPSEKYATLFLAVYDGRTRRLTYSNGGHLPPILIAKDGSVRRLEAGGTVVGLFDGMTYDEGCVDIHPGEVFVAYSDGVTEPENDFGEFGEDRLIDLVRQNRNMPLAQISQIVTRAVDTWIGDKEQPDDVTLVLARAR